MNWKKLYKVCNFECLFRKKRSVLLTSPVGDLEVFFVRVADSDLNVLGVEGSFRWSEEVYVKI